MVAKLNGIGGATKPICVRDDAQLHSDIGTFSYKSVPDLLIIVFPVYEEAVLNQQSILFT